MPLRMPCVRQDTGCQDQSVGRLIVGAVKRCAALVRSTTGQSERAVLSHAMRKAMPVAARLMSTPILPFNDRPLVAFAVSENSLESDIYF